MVSPKRFTISGSICKPFVHPQFNFCAENEIKIQFHSSQCGYLVSPIPLRDAVISSVWIFWHPCGRKCEHMDMTLSVDYVCSIVLCSYDSASVRQLFVIQFVPRKSDLCFVPLIALLFHDPECLHTIFGFFPMKILMAL